MTKENFLGRWEGISLLALRLSMGWLFLYAGVTKIFNPEWSAAGYLQNAQTFSFFYNWLLNPGILPIVNFINEWGLTLLGLSLIFGVLIQISSFLGALLMLLYYFPVLNFPYAGEHFYIIDEHIIYFLVLIYFAFSSSIGYGGLEEKIKEIWRRRK